MKQIPVLVFILYFPIGLFSQAEGDSLFNIMQVHTIGINFSQTDFWTQIVNNKTFDDTYDSSTYIPAQMSIDDDIIDSVGIQFIIIPQPINLSG